MRFTQRLFIVSKWLHKYAGLLLSPYFLWMGLSGILLNHQNLIAGVSLPLRVVGEEQRYRNWSRGACRGMVFSSRPTSTTGLLFGKEGVWVTTGGSEGFSPLNAGLPGGARRDAISLVVLPRANGTGEVAVVSDAKGLWSLGLPEGVPAGKWQPVDLPGEHDRVVKLVRTSRQLLVFTQSGAYAASLSDAPSLRFSHVSLRRGSARDADSIDGIHFAFGVHSGEAWGTPCKLLMDLAGLGMVLLAVTGLGAWYVPWRNWLRAKLRLGRGTPRPRFLSWCNRYHRSVGLWVSPLFVVSTLSGLALCIPLIMLWFGKEVDPRWAPGMRAHNPWSHKIESALYDAERNTLVIAASDGYWEAPADLSQPFRRLAGGPPGNVMGLEVFECDADSRYVVGHLGGLFSWDRKTGEVAELSPDPSGRPRRGPTGGFMATAWFRDPAGRAWGAHFQGGLRCLDGDSTDYAMPKEAVTHGRIPLWLFLHYLHNGRIWTMLPVPARLLLALLAAFFAGAIVLTGIYDWTYERGRRTRRHP